MTFRFVKQLDYVFDSHIQLSKAISELLRDVLYALNESF